MQTVNVTIVYKNKNIEESTIVFAFLEVIIERKDLCCVLYAFSLQCYSEQCFVRVVTCIIDNVRRLCYSCKRLGLIKCCNVFDYLSIYSMYCLNVTPSACYMLLQGSLEQSLLGLCNQNLLRVALLVYCHRKATCNDIQIVMCCRDLYIKRW